MDRAELRPVPSFPAVPAPFTGPWPAPASLPPAALAQRLVELCGDERNLRVDFLLHLMEFDHRRAYSGVGYPSLWAYCTEVLRLREGATWRRIEAMKLLRRFPSLEVPLRDGRICLTTVSLLGPVLTEENVEELVERAAFLSKVETQRLVATVRQGEAAEGGPGDDAEVRSGPQTLSLLAAGSAPGPTSGPAACGAATPVDAGAPAPAAPVAAGPVPGARAPAPAAPAQRTELRPAGADAWSLRVTLDDAARADLLQLAALTAHSTRGDLAAVLRDAVRCALATHRKRRGAARTERKPKAAPATPASSTVTPPSPDARSVPPANEPAASSSDAPERLDPRAVPMAVREAVWERDGGRCAWVSPEGKRCGSTWKLQLGHVRPVALGGQATVEGLRLECAPHNHYEAIRVFGRRHMARFQPSLDSRRRK
jgi:hypothetical protein